MQTRPTFSPADAEAIAREHYGVVAQAAPLDSERDQNFKLTADEANYVLKVSNAETDPAWLEFENAALHLSAAATRFRTPRVHRTLAHQSVLKLRDPAGQDCLVRLIGFLDGATLAASGPVSVANCEAIGAALAELDLLLVNLNQHASGRRTFRWDLRSGPAIVAASVEQYRRAAGEREFTAESVPAISLNDRADLLEHYLESVATIEGRWRKLPQAVIHNDANDYNILLNADPELEGPPVGLIDFGDMIYSQQINELAIAAAYLLLQDGVPAVDWQAALSGLVVGYHRLRPLSEAERSVVFPLAMLRLCQSVAIAETQTRLDPENAYLSISSKPAWSALERFATVEPLDVHVRLSDACQTAELQALAAADDESDDFDVLDVSQMIAHRERWLAPSLSLSYRKPLHLVRGRGQYLYDAQNATYLDCVNNVCHVGHSHPAVIDAAERQWRCLNTNSRYLYEKLTDYARALAGTLPDPLEVCFLVNSGSEANDLALRLARAVTGGRDVLVLDHAYHGHTSALIELSPYKFNGPGGQGRAEHVHVLPMPDLYRGKFPRDQDRDAVACGIEYADDARRRVEAAIDRGARPAALFAESILGCGGQVPLPPGYLPAVYQVAREHGAVCVADEVQTGLGRVGTHFWAFEQQGVVPDIVTMGKPIGNGHPLAAVVTTRGVAQAFDNGMEYFNTFGGNPVSCAVGLAVLQVIQRESLQQHAGQVGGELRSELQRMQQEFPQLGDVRGSGLFLGLELVTDPGTRQPDPGLAGEVVEAMKQRRILLSTDGPDRNVIKFKPPMVFSSGDADRLVMTLSEVFRAARRTSR